jgi:hypothetical protein
MASDKNDLPSVSPQPSRDPVYQPGSTVGGNSPSDVQPANVTSDIRPFVGGGDANAARRGFVGFPKTLYHPVLGGRQVNDPNEEASLPGPAHNWWPTAGEADMHRTDLEAQEVIHHARDWKLRGHEAEIKGEDIPPTVIPEGEEAPVRYSVQAEESLNSGVEPH